jgi:protoporphyrinogen IX oxidase
MAGLVPAIHVSSSFRRKPEARSAERAKEKLDPGFRRRDERVKRDATTATLENPMLLSYIKAFHVIAIIAWMAGLLYLPRLFVYHADSAKGSQQSETFKVMEKRLLRIITTPAMIASWILGLTLAFSGVIDWKADGWFHAKLALVVLLSAFHGMLAKWTKDFAQDRNTHDARFYRMVNEVPTLLMIGIVILVIVRPF